MHNEDKSESCGAVKSTCMFLGSSITFIGAFIAVTQSLNDNKNPLLPLALTLMTGSFLAAFANGIDMCRSMVVRSAGVPEQAPLEDINIDNLGFAARERARHPREAIQAFPEISVLEEIAEEGGSYTYDVRANCGQNLMR